MAHCNPFRVIPVLFVVLLAIFAAETTLGLVDGHISADGFKHGAVVFLGSGGSRCSATYIGDGVFITAAHCHHLAKSQENVSVARSYKNGEEIKTEVFAQLKNWKVHPGFTYKGLNHISPYDLALFNVDKPVPKSFVKLELAQEDWSPRHSVDLMFIGAGATEEVFSQSPANRPVMTGPYIGEIRYSWEYTFPYTRFGAKIQEGDLLKLSILQTDGTLPCVGDSGGGVIEQQADQPNTIIGVLAAVGIRKFGRDERCWSHPIAVVPVGVFKKWITDNKKELSTVQK